MKERTWEGQSNPGNETDQDIHGQIFRSHTVRARSYVVAFSLCPAAEVVQMEVAERVNSDASALI